MCYILLLFSYPCMQKVQASKLPGTEGASHNNNSNFRLTQTPHQNDNTGLWPTQLARLLQLLIASESIKINLVSIANEPTRSAKCKGSLFADRNNDNFRHTYTVSGPCPWMDHILHLVCIWGWYFLAAHTHVLCMGSGSATCFFPAPRLVHSLPKYFFKFQLWYWIQLYTPTCPKYLNLILVLILICIFGSTYRKGEILKQKKSGMSTVNLFSVTQDTHGSRSDFRQDSTIQQPQRWI